MSKRNRKNREPVREPQNNQPAPNIIRFEDEFGQSTYLRIMNGNTLYGILADYDRVLNSTEEGASSAVERLKKWIQAHSEGKQPPISLNMIEWAIRQQLLVLLTDEEISEYKMRNQGVVASK